LKPIHLLIIPPVACLFGLPLAACQDNGEGAVEMVQDADLRITRVTADDLANLDDGARLSLGTARDTDVLVFDPSQGPLDFGRIELTCPNGQRMGMDVWLLDLQKQRGADLQTLTAGEFSLARTQDNAIDGLEQEAGAEPNLEPQYDQNCPPPNCVHNVCVGQTCYWCPDGQYVCSCQWTSVCEPCNPE